MRENKFSFREYRAMAFGLSLPGFLFFILACTIKNMGWLTVFFWVLVALCLTGSCVCLYLANKSASGHTNPFLYDRRRQVPISVEELSFEFVNDTLSYYLSDFTENAIELWNGIPKELEMALQAAPAYRTPVAFQMLHALASLEEKEITALFSVADKRTVAAVCRAVKAGGDKEMADIIFEMKCEPERLGSRVVPFFVKNKRIFGGRMVRYIKEHIAEYETVKKGN